MREELESTIADWMMALEEEALASIHTQLSEAAFAEAWEQGRSLTTDEAVALAVASFDEATSRSDPQERRAGDSNPDTASQRR